MQEIKIELVAKASETVSQEVEKELSKDDPAPERAKAILLGENLEDEIQNESEHTKRS